ncbi:MULTISPECIES: hypothetical protein [unclassified Mesorhizobium]|uniref:hypothetical protein n=1 Tax=unclassified Mesorhizobium TaxID=325217 RepID=UPI000FCB139C|nr:MULTISPECIES: hypothetical protein [unclassified Mesorhizobium]RUX97440.1 hypothetical protein EN993_03825 [Mesorhizobium sp. M7D.F.Ca.US.004.01.2.1]RVA36626.1 hypothetical protein EN935_01635 [Mesorhizobium sp. M7D.F.Ca.US.004.03.1.1]
MREPSKINFDALRNAIYHTARRNYYDLLNRMMSLIVVAAGAGAVADFERNLASPAALAFAATMAGLLQLVFDFGGRARTHEFLQRRFYELTADIAEVEKPTPLKVRTWEATLNRLYAEEPPPMRAMDAIAYNAAAESLGSDKSKRIKVTWWQSLNRYWWAFNGAEFPFVSDAKAKGVSPSA